MIFFSPDIFHLTCLQRLKNFFFHKFLKSMKDFVDEDRVWNGFDVKRQRVLSVDYGQIICDMFRNIDRE